MSLKIKLDHTLIQAIPNIKLGINHYTKITVSESPQMLKGRLQLFQEQLFFELEEKELTDYAGIQAWRTIWRTLGADPNRYRNSVESLFRRIKKQNYIQPFHSAVDLNNFFSLQYELPIGIYDANSIVGNMNFSVGNEEDGYDGLNGRFNSMHNMPFLKDNYSPFGSPFVDSIRTAVTEETTEAIQLFYLQPTMDSNKAFELTKACGNMFTSISGGDVQSYILHANEPEISLD